MNVSKKGFDAVQEIIGINFKKPQLLQQALRHRSYLSEDRRVAEHNERLEFLGDAIIECITTAYLYRNYPRSTEGELTKMRSILVCMDTLWKVGEEMNLWECILMARGQRLDSTINSRSRGWIIAAVIEAIVAAIYLDRGMGTAELFCLEFLLPRLEVVRREGTIYDPKSKLQELIQGRNEVTPSYRVLDEEGPDHAKTFTVGVYAGSKLLAQEKGGSKKIAEESAARLALEKEFGITNISDFATNLRQNNTGPTER